MKVVTKLLADFVAWRWAPTVGLLSASVLFVLIVVGLVPTEIGVGVASPKFGGKPRLAATSQAEGLTATALATNEDSTGHAEPAPVVAAVQPTRPSDFGRRGFSPVIDRPEPPEAPPPAPPPLPVVAPAPPPQPAPQPAALTATAAPASTAPPGRVAGLFQSVQNALRGGQFNNLVPPSGSAGGPVAPGGAPAVPGGPGAPGNPAAPGAPGDSPQPAPAPGAPGSPAAPGTEGAPSPAPEAANEVAPVH
jgi:hypothetical protein